LRPPVLLLRARLLPDLRLLLVFQWRLPAVL
jgi:hypothetical protein